MLIELHVKNLALIDEEEIPFGEGLNILTGETGAGKSIILGALELALGGKPNPGSLRDADSEGYAEAVFAVTSDAEKEALAGRDIEVYDDEVILSRRIGKGRSSAKINGESVPAGKLREAGELLLDIHGQNEHQSLLKKSAHLTLLDAYAAEELAGPKAALLEAYRDYTAVRDEYDKANLDESDRKRELSFLTHEVDEISAAALTPGEDESLEEEYRRLSHSEKIREALGEVYRSTSSGGAADEIGRALQELRSVEQYDEAISSLAAMLSDAEAIIGDFNRELVSYQDDAEDGGERFAVVTARLDLINTLKSKYGRTIDEILLALSQKQERIDRLNDYDEYLTQLGGRLAKSEAQVSSLCDEISGLRRTAAEKLCAEVKTALIDLNFLDVQLEMDFSELSHYTANGRDEAEFLISLNPGAPLRLLREVASGGELSRIMLAIKTVIAEEDSIDTLIFDEIDAGISGRTAQAVAEKLSELARRHQIICITHLPQIAAMADHHFLIEKSVTDGATISSIRELSENDIPEELARMLGGAELTDTVRENAREMKRLADERKR